MLAAVAITKAVEKQRMRFAEADRAKAPRGDAVSILMQTPFFPSPLSASRPLFSEAAMAIGRGMWLKRGSVAVTVPF
jgi:hypothetical protein